MLGFYSIILLLSEQEETLPLGLLLLLKFLLKFFGDSIFFFLF
jgi:hypothetical protein